MLFILKTNKIDICERTLKFMEKGDKVVLIQDGVFLAQNHNNKFISSVKEKGVQILILENDLKLRGVKKNIDDEVITYEDMINLIKKDKIFS